MNLYRNRPEINTTMKRVLLTTCYYRPKIGGLETFIENLSCTQKKKNINTWIITSRYDIKLLEEEDIANVTVKRLLPDFFWSTNNNNKFNYVVILKLIANINVLFAINKFIVKFKPQVINICYPTPLSVYFILLSYFRKVAIVVSLHGEVTQQMPHVCTVEKLLFRFILKKADFVTACSRNLLEEAVKIAPEIINKSRYIYNGIVLNGYLPEKGYYTGYAHKNRYILTIANLYRHKGIDILLMAMKTVYDNSHDVDLVIVGHGAQMKRLIEIASLLKIENRVIFKGTINDETEKKCLLHNCEFFVLPSRVEPFGIVNLEAMAAGKAIVAARTGGIPEIVKDGVNGILVEPYNDKALAEGMMRLLNDKELRERLGRNGRKMAEDPKFSWDNIAEQYVEVYKNVSKTKC
jgi:glycosyltransferase involved in cell wall biosynthesis